MYNVVKFQAPFERLKFYNLSGDIALRKAIILQAIIDATNTSSTKQGKKIAQEAKEWLFGDSDYFQQICLEAELEVSFVRKVAKEMMKLNQPLDSDKSDKLSVAQMTKNTKEEKFKEDVINYFQNFYIYYTKTA